MTAYYVVFWIGLALFLTWQVRVAIREFGRELRGEPRWARWSPDELARENRARNGQRPFRSWSVL